ncbi:MAG: GNAT family N-acetyltransferase, partial [Serratia liquefaciens]|nr:GNAT family N-acetyltransferase [Serratia liquefaciens]
QCRWPGSEAAFQVYPLAENALAEASGAVEYSEPFNRF